MPRLLVLVICITATAMAFASGEPAPLMSPAKAERHAEETHMVMHKSPGCGCCAVWAEHVQEHGISVESIADPDLQALKARLGIPPAARSCHTAKIGPYLIEGHVPAGDILRLLAERPDDVKALSVPGMPLGSPGMEHPQPQYYETLALMKDGTLQVFAKHEPGEDYSPQPHETSEREDRE